MHGKHAAMESIKSKLGAGEKTLHATTEHTLHIELYSFSALFDAEFVRIHDLPLVSGALYFCVK